jgi:hypothetical protein
VPVDIIQNDWYIRNPFDFTNQTSYSIKQVIGLLLFGASFSVKRVGWIVIRLAIVLATNGITRGAVVVCG